MTDLFSDVKLQISLSYTYKRIIYNEYMCNWSKPHIYVKGMDGEKSLCGKHIFDGGLDNVNIDVCDTKNVCQKCFKEYSKLKEQ